MFGSKFCSVFATTMKSEHKVPSYLAGRLPQKGAVLQMYSLDMVSKGVIDVVSNEADFVAITHTLKVPT